MIETDSDVMIDLETLGIGENAVVTQFAGCYFNRFTGEIFGEYQVILDIESELQKGFIVTAATIAWWMRQSDEARRHIYNNTGIKSESAWLSIKGFLDHGKTFWSHATFDFPIVQHHFKAHNIKPLSFRLARDLRTLYDVAGYKPSKKDMEGIRHNAIDDCRFQVKCVAECFKILRGEKQNG